MKNTNRYYWRRHNCIWHNDSVAFVRNYRVSYIYSRDGPMDRRVTLRNRVTLESGVDGKIK